MNKDYFSNIPKFYLFRFVGSLDLTVAIFVLFMLSNNLTMTQVMLIESIFLIMVLSLEVPSGVFADLYGRKTALAISLLCASASFIIFGLGSTFWVFLLAQAVLAFSWSLESGADLAFVYDSLIKGKNFPKIYGQSNFITYIAFAISALLSGFLAALLGFRALFFISAGLFFLGFLVSLRFTEPPIKKKSAKKHYLHMKGALKFAFSSKVVRNLIIYFAVFSAFSSLAWFIFQPYLKDYSTAIIGIAIFIYYVSGGIGSLISGKLMAKVRQEKLLIYLLLIGSASFLVLSFITPLFGIFFIATLSFSIGIRDISVSEEINIHTDSHHRATVVSIQSMTRGLIQAAFAPLIGYLVDIFSPAAA
ncbi:MAG TPA: MFS transporter, partial [Candidatus Nanoarchaeia archaeon]|nr:MFS transporter [Candidatus Nanoarchaeia archaeon]